MSIDAVTSRIRQIVEMQQQLSQPAAAPAIGTAPKDAGVTGAKNSQSFGSMLASAIGIPDAQAQVLPSALGSSTGTPAGLGLAPATGATGGQSYVSPVPGWSASRIDQGSDGTLSSAGFVAPGRSQILIADTTNPGWRGGGYIAARLLDGPNAGDVYYVAEGIAPSTGLAVGQIVPAGTQIAAPAVNPYNGILGNIEAGWASPSNPGTPLAQALPGYSGDVSTAAITAGSSWNDFISSLGAPASHVEAGAAAPDPTLLNGLSAL